MGRCLLAGSALGGSLLLPLLLLATWHHHATTCLLPSGASCLNPQAGAIVREAIALQEHLSGANATRYDLHDPVIAPAYQFWVNWCGAGGVPCHQAVSGNLQCVSFVNAVFALAGSPLPASGNGQDFWPLYEHQAGWLRIPATAGPPSARGLPQPGDLMVWKGGGHWEPDAQGQQVWAEYGHVAVVIDMRAPSAGRDGSVTVAQANAPGNRWPASHQADPGNWLSMPLHPDLSVSTWPGYLALGYLRAHARV